MISERNHAEDLRSRGVPSWFIYWPGTHIIDCREFGEATVLDYIVLRDVCYNTLLETRSLARRMTLPSRAYTGTPGGAPISCR